MQRALLARLVVAAGQPLSPGLLIGELWDESPPRDPPHALQAQISRLRSVLAVDIELRNGGYCLDPASVRTDSVRFEQLSQQADRLLTDGNLNQGAECLSEALDLWHGPAFANLPDISTLRAESARLEKIRAVVLRDRIDVDLARGNHAEVIPELHVLIEEHPFVECYWAQLMTALYCEGRTHEALAIFARASEMLIPHLGGTHRSIEVSGALARVRTAILQEQPVESLFRWPAAESVIDTDAIVSRPEDGTPASVIRNRSNDLAALIRSHRMLILTGPAGIGKTHLLRAIRATLEAGGCWAPLFSPSAMNRTTALGVFTGLAGVGVETRSSPAALINFLVRHRSTTVLLVDDVNGLDEASLSVITHLTRTSWVPVILTSRDLRSAPEGIRALHNDGRATEVEVHGLSDAEQALTQMLGGQPAADAFHRLLEAAGGNPGQLREVITGSLNDGRLVQTSQGWELRGSPVTMPRLADLASERFNGLDGACLEAAATVAIAGTCPAAAIDRTERRALVRAGVLEPVDQGWVRLAHPSDREVLHAACSASLWRDLTRGAVTVLLSPVASAHPEARQRAHVLALELDDPLNVEDTLALAERALEVLTDGLGSRAKPLIAR